MALGTEARRKTEASCSEHTWTPRHSPGEGGDEGCVGGASIWFAANEHCGVPVAGAPSGLSGTEETGVSRAGTRPGAGPSLRSLAPSHAPLQQSRAEGGGGCGSAHASISSFFFPILNSFLTFSMPWLLLLLLQCMLSARRAP